MAQVSLKDAREVTQKIVSEVHPEAVILFGSVARRGEGNDLDLLILKDGEKSKWEMYKEVRQVIKNFYTRFNIDFFVATPLVARNLFLRGSAFLRLIQREGRSLYMKDTVGEWLHHAKEDLAMADCLFKGKYYRGACYHAQQALEKAMKGLLIQKGWDLVKTHNLEELNSYGKKFGMDFEIPEDALVLAESLYRGRYPGEEGLIPTGDPGEADASLILSTAKTFFGKWKMLP